MVATKKMRRNIGPRRSAQEVRTGSRAITPSPASRSARLHSPGASAETTRWAAPTPPGVPDRARFLCEGGRIEFFFGRHIFFPKCEVCRQRPLEAYNRRAMLELEGPGAADRGAGAPEAARLVLLVQVGYSVDDLIELACTPVAGLPWLRWRDDGHATQQSDTFRGTPRSCCCAR